MLTVSSQKILQMRRGHLRISLHIILPHIFKVTSRSSQITPIKPRTDRLTVPQSKNGIKLQKLKIASNNLACCIQADELSQKMIANRIKSFKQVSSNQIIPICSQSTESLTDLAGNSKDNQLLTTHLLSPIS